MKLALEVACAWSIAAMVGLASLQAGCDARVGEQIASLILPTDAHDIALSVNKKINAGRFEEAQDEAVAFLAEHDDNSGQLAWALARISARLGSHDLAVKYASEAVRAGAVSGVQLVSEPMLEPVRSDRRFRSLAASINADHPG